MVAAFFKEPQGDDFAAPSIPALCITDMSYVMVSDWSRGQMLFGATQKGAAP